MASVTEAEIVDDYVCPMSEVPVEEELDESELWVDDESTPPAPPAPDTDIEYAPRQKIRQGEKKLAVVRIKWASGRSDSTSTAQNAAKTVANNYERLSRGLFRIIPKVYTVSVPWPNNYRYVKSASQRAKGQIRSDWYAILTAGATGVSHAGGNTAILLASRAITHEVGHLIGLEHANRYELDKKFVGRKGTTGSDGYELDLKYFKLNGSADGSSVMSTFSSAQLTAPQLYSMGWLQEKEVALHKADGPAKLYNVHGLTSAYTPGYVKAIMVPGPETGGRDVFLSVVSIKNKGKDKGTRPALTLHLGNPGSNRIITFGSKPLSFRGVTFEAKKQEGNKYTVEVRPFVPKP